MNRRKTQYSKNMAKYIEEKEKEENDELNIKTPIKSNKKVKKKKMVKVIKMKWRKSIQAYAKVTEYEEHSVESNEIVKETPKKNLTLDINTINNTPNKEDQNNLDINRLKKFVNTPKNIKSQLRPEDNQKSLVNSASNKALKPQLSFDIKKSHSTINLGLNSNKNNNSKSSAQNTELKESNYTPVIPEENENIMKKFTRRETTFYQDKARDFFPIFENFGDCPENHYRLIIYKMDKNSKTDKIFFNNPTNYTFPEKLLTFDINANKEHNNLSKILVKNLKAKRNGKNTNVRPNSKYHSMSEVVNMKKTLKPSLYHDLNALEMDFSFPEDRPKTPPKKVYHKLHNGAEQIDEFTFRIGGIEFKDYRAMENTKSASNLPTANNKSKIERTSSQNQRLIKGETKHKSFTNLPSRTTNDNLIVSNRCKQFIK